MGPVAGCRRRDDGKRPLAARSSLETTVSASGPRNEVTAAPRLGGGAGAVSRESLPWSDPGTEVESRLLEPLPRLLKGGSERLLALLGGLAVLPLILLIGLLVKLTSRGPVFYRSHRIGRGGAPLGMWKFRTMVHDAEARLNRYLETRADLRREWEEKTKLELDPRVTWIGRWLRRTSLDELPQVWNVLRGEMSLVGPRPLLPEDVPKYGERFAVYLQVLPGITGLWQVSGRSNTTYQRRIELDCHYVRHWSPLLDLRILARTVRVILRGEGAY